MGRGGAPRWPSSSWYLSVTEGTHQELLQRGNRLETHRQSASASPEGAPPPKQPVAKLKQSSWGSRDQVSKEASVSPAIDESFSFAANRSMWLKKDNESAATAAPSSSSYKPSPSTAPQPHRPRPTSR